MKNNFLLVSLIFMLFTATLNSQILNPGFEDWTDDEPDKWYTNNIKELGLKPVTLSFDAYSGSYALKLEVLDIEGGNHYPALIHSGDNMEGFPISLRHGSFLGFYKFLPKETEDVLTVAVTMWKEGFDDPIGVGVWDTQEPVSTFKQFSVPIHFFSTEVPDNIEIIIAVEDGIGTYAIIDELSVSGPVNSYEEETIYSGFSFSQNYPNPFNSTTKIEYFIPEYSFVELKIYNLIGVELATLVSEYQNTGTYRADFNAEYLQSGIYIAKLTANNFARTIQMNLIK